MKTVPLKYLMPTLIFTIGLVLMTLHMLIDMKTDYANMKKEQSFDAKNLGHLLAGKIEKSNYLHSSSRYVVSGLISKYHADNLDLVEIYDDKSKLIFENEVSNNKNISSYIASKDIINDVKKSRFAQIICNDDLHVVEGYFPISMPKKENEVFSKRGGVLYIVLDSKKAYNSTTKNIINNSIINFAIIFIMVSLLSALMHMLVFRRLNLLYNATCKLSKGDFNVHVKSGGNDELDAVITSFNNVSKQLLAYKEQMQTKVDFEVSKRSKQEKLLIQQNRLAAMGEMISNIAHQWRQPLNALGLLIQKVGISYDRGTINDEFMEKNITKANFLLNSMSSTIDDFRDFFKPNKEKVNFYFSDIFDDAQELVGGVLINSNIELSIEISKELSYYGYKNEFLQVVINILNNAKDALLENKIVNPKIDIKTEEINGVIQISIYDNAGGIDDAIVQDIFNPYFSTKDEGKGTGIGLYMSKMIIEDNMDGKLNVSNIENGALFMIEFNLK